MDPRDLPPEHGFTVLPGVPLPPRALPHGPVAPEGAAAPDGPPEPVVEPFPGAEPRPAVPSAPSASSAPPVSPAAAPTPGAAPAKTPWWKKEIGGKKAAASPQPVAAPQAAPVAAPVASPVPPPEAASAAAPEADAASVPAPPAASRRGRHAAPEPEPQGRRTLILLLAAGLALIALAVALFVWPGLLVGSQGAEGSQGAGQTGGAVTSAPITLVMPAELAGLSRLTGAPDAALQERISSSPVEGLSEPVGAVYGTDGTPSLQVIAWRAVDPPAQDAVEAAFTGFEGSSGATVSDVQQLPPGDLGGHMACGATTVQQADAVQCFWADAQSFGSITVLAPKDRPSAHATALQARAGAVQTQ